nr:MAG TPA: hypothetical protein [Caudoviricetes sp.]
MLKNTINRSLRPKIKPKTIDITEVFGFFNFINQSIVSLC